ALDATGTTAPAAAKATATDGPDLRAGLGNLGRLPGGHAFGQIRVAGRVMIPIDRHRRHARAGGELILDREFIREGEGRQGVFLDALDADQRLRTQLQSPVCRAENVNAPVT